MHFHKTSYSIWGKPCCRNCFQLFHNVTKFHVESALSLRDHGKHTDRRMHGVDPAAHLGRPALVGHVIERWVAQWIATNVQVGHLGDRHIAFNPIVTWVYREYRDNCLSDGTAAGSYSEFISIFHRHMHGIGVPRTKFDRKVCSVCYLLQVAIRRAKLRKEDSTELQLKLDDHNQQQYAARRNFYDRREYARCHSEEVTLLSADGTFPTLSPAVPQDSEFKRKLSKLSSNLFTVVNYSAVEGERDHIFLSLGASGKEDANAFISFLHWFISSLRDRGQLGRRLELQLDSGLSCKNRWVMGYLAALVAWKWVEKVDVYFLIVGHTHEHIDGVTGHIRRPHHFGAPMWSLDAFFRSWAKFFPNTIAPTLHVCFTAPGSVEAFASHNPPVVSLMHDFKDLLGGCLNKLHHFTRDISCWSLGSDGRCSVKGLVTDQESVSSDRPVLASVPNLNTLKKLNVAGAGNVYAPVPPLFIVESILDSLKQLGKEIVPEEDVEYWRVLRDCLLHCDLPLPTEQQKKTTLKPSKFSVAGVGKRQPIRFSITTGGPCQKDVHSDVEDGDDGDAPDHHHWGPIGIGEESDEDGDVDDELREYAVHSLLDYRCVQGDEEYLVHWAHPYDLAVWDSWEPVSALAGSAALINRFHDRRGLSKQNAAHAEGGREARLEEQAIKSAKRNQECPKCGKMFQRLVQHTPHCHGGAK